MMVCALVRKGWGHLCNSIFTLVFTLVDTPSRCYPVTHIEHIPFPLFLYMSLLPGATLLTNSYLKLSALIDRISAVEAIAAFSAKRGF